jgi:hypothetical protein
MRRGSTGGHSTPSGVAVTTSTSAEMPTYTFCPLRIDALAASVSEASSLSTLSIR